MILKRANIHNEIHVPRDSQYAFPTHDNHDMCFIQPKISIYSLATFSVCIATLMSYFFSIFVPTFRLPCAANSANCCQTVQLQLRGLQSQRYQKYFLISENANLGGNFNFLTVKQVNRTETYRFIYFGEVEVVSHRLHTFLMGQSPSK